MSDQRQLIQDGSTCPDTPSDPTESAPAHPLCPIRWAALIATLIVIGALTVGAVTFRMFAAPKNTQAADHTLCDSVDMRNATASLKVTVAEQNRDTPLLSTHLRVEVPQNQFLATDLEQSTDSVAFKSAVQCLLGSEFWSEGKYVDDRRGSAPRITDNGDKIVAEVDQSIEITSQNGASLDDVDIADESSHHWRIDVMLPKALASVGTFELTVEASPNSLFEPLPWPANKITDSQMVWTDNNASTRAPQYSAFVRHDWRARNTLFSGGRAGNALASCFFWVDGAAIPVLLVWFIRRLRRRRLISPQKKGHLSPALFVVPTALMAIAGLTIAVAPALVSPNFMHWVGLIRIEAAVVLLIALWSALVWRVDYWLCVSLAVLGSAALGVAARTTNDAAPLAQSISWAVYTFALAALIVVGVFEAVKRLWTSDSYRPSAWTAVIAVCIAVLFTTERVLLNMWYYHGQEWLDTAPRGATMLGLDLQNTAYTTLSALDWLIAVVPVFCIWRLSRDLDHGSAQSRAVPAIGGALSVYVVYWALPWSAWTLPVAIPTTVAIWLYLRTRTYLSVPADRERTMAQLVEGKSVKQLQQDVRRSQIHQQRLKTLERAMTTGGDMAAVRHWEKSAPGLHVSPRPTRGVAGRRLGTWPIGQSPADGVNPIDVVLAVGPSKSPAENARYALKAALPMSFVAAAIMAWLWHRNDPVQLPNLDDSAIFGVANDYVWSLLSYGFGAAAAGLLWHYLPGKRGAVKVLPIVLLFAATPALRVALPALFGGHVGLTPIADALIFTSILMAVGVWMDSLSLRGAGSMWTSSGRLVLESYRVQNLAAQLTFAASLIGVVITIWNVFHGAGDGGGGHDPSLVNHPSSGGSR